MQSSAVGSDLYLYDSSLAPSRGLPDFFGLNFLQGPGSFITYILTQPVTAVGFGIIQGSSPGLDNLRVSVNGQFVGQFGINGLTTSFFGVGSTDPNVLISSVRFGTLAPDGPAQIYEVVSGVPTPEPSSIALLGTGLLGIAAAVRRRFS